MSGKVVIDDLDHDRDFAPVPAYGTAWTSGTYDEKFKLTQRINPQVHDAKLAQELWDRSEALLDIHPQP